MAIEVRRVEKLTDEERRIFFGWGRDIFGSNNLNLKMRRARWHVLVYADGRLVSHFGIYQAKVRVGARYLGINQWRPRRLARRVYRLVNLNVWATLVAGAGGMVTLPGEQGQGYALIAGQHGIQFARDELHADFGFLFSPDRLQAFHEQHWNAKVLEAPVYFDQPSGKVRCPMNAYSISLTGKEWPPGIVDVDGLPW